jgi:hypothetical protein
MIELNMNERVVASYHDTLDGFTDGRSKVAKPRPVAVEFAVRYLRVEFETACSLPVFRTLEQICAAAEEHGFSIHRPHLGWKRYCKQIMAELNALGIHAAYKVAIPRNGFWLDRL